MAYTAFLERGTKRTFAGLIDWPGWSRAGHDQQSALQSLIDTGPRYARLLQLADIQFEPPTTLESFEIAEQLQGNATTDFGAPNIELASDSLPIDDTELQRFQQLLQAYWAALDAAAAAARDKELRKGPRGGGRDLAGVLQHVIAVDQSYLTRLGVKAPKLASDDLAAQLEQTHQALLESLSAAAHGQLPTKGPRGGAIWPARTFVRRVGWHTLDHAWEIEDRIL